MDINVEYAEVLSLVRFEVTDFAKETEALSNAGAEQIDAAMEHELYMSLHTLHLRPT